MQFTEGQSVRCINNFNSKLLAQGQIYTVKGSGLFEDTVYIQEFPDVGFYTYRFEIVENKSPFAQWEKDVGVSETCIA